MLFPRASVEEQGWTVTIPLSECQLLCVWSYLIKTALDLEFRLLKQHTSS